MIFLESELLSKPHQLLFDHTSGRKRKERDKVFASFGYDCVLSRYIAQSENLQNAKQADVADA